MIDSIFYSQQKALDELRAESEQLYQEAIRVINYFIYVGNNKICIILLQYYNLIHDIHLYFQNDFELLPYTIKGPSKTPAIENYDSPDGVYINMTRKFDGET